MSALYDDHSNDGWNFLLMDATNAYNLVNRVATLWNAEFFGQVAVTLYSHV